MAAWMAASTPAEKRWPPLQYLETVATETPAASATSRRVGRRFLIILVKRLTAIYTRGPENGRPFHAFVARVFARRHAVYLAAGCRNNDGMVNRFTLIALSWALLPVAAPCAPPDEPLRVW